MSAVTEPELAGGTCPNCASRDLVAVKLTLSDGPAGFFHCRRCEHRWWSTESQGLALADVLSRVS